ncbi:alpha-glucosidase C-terminal domain-containing protein [candidate division KSB1 bacterium]|nr:alpha-glucosidase C-terminal domain-containing protein [candidate division KSB1 bacterium]
MKYITITFMLISIFGCLSFGNTESMQTKTESIEVNQQSEEFVPQWAKSVIWYQIFPERFRNGDRGNDPTAADIIGADPAEPPKQWRVHPWGSDWYKLMDYEIENGEKELWKHLLRRRYGGDLQGIIDKLDYLHDLGITALYLNPVFDSPSLHKYDGASYHHIDPNFGPDPGGDRELMKQENPLDPGTWVWTSADELALKLIDEAHERGMRIIFDGVFNHMGINSFAFQDLKKNQQKSPYKDWFIVNSWADPSNGNKFEYVGWWGVKSLPELKEDENGIVEGPRDYIFAATQRWMNPKNMGIAYGIDGWRLDVAFCIKHPFWKAWRKHVKAINPEAYLTAEIVDKPEEVQPYMQGDEFDAEMNYNFAFASSEFFFDPPSTRLSASEFDARLRYLRNLYPKGVAAVTQNLMGSHDSNRIASLIVNRGIGKYGEWGKYYEVSKAADNPDYKVRKPNAEEIAMQKLFVIFQMTYFGAPMIYYGDEVGMWGANDPDCRKPMIWPDIQYSAEVTNPDGSKRDPDVVEINQDLFAHYKKMIGIRNQSVALQRGTFKTLLVEDKKDVFVFERALGDERVIIALNNSIETAEIVLPEFGSATWNDSLNGKNELQFQNKKSLTIEPKWAVILQSDEKK